MNQCNLLYLSTFYYCVSQLQRLNRHDHFPRNWYLHNVVQETGTKSKGINFFIVFCTKLGRTLFMLLIANNFSIRCLTIYVTNIVPLTIKWALKV